jgi:hypothetical protein
MCCACETSSCLRAHVQARFTEPTSTTAWTTHARSSRRSITMTSSEPLLTRSPRRRAAHAATRGRSEARWHGSGQQAGVAATSPTWSYRPIRAGCRPAPQGSMSISTVLRRQGRISPTRWAISLLDAAMRAVVFPGLAGQQRVMAATLPETSRTRRHTRLKRHQVVPTHQSEGKARRSAPVAQHSANRQFGPAQQRLHELSWAHDSPWRSEVRVGISCLARGIDRLDALEDEPHRRPRVHEGWVGAIWVLTGTVPGDPAQCVSRGCHQCVTPLRMAEFPAAASLRWGDECTVIHFEPK